MSLTRIPRVRLSITQRRYDLVAAVAPSQLTRRRQMLTYYELDLGLNHVVRKWSEPTDTRANLLIQVPVCQIASSDRYVVM